MSRKDAIELTIRARFRNMFSETALAGVEKPGTEKGLSLGTAMAISGAPASPSMGFYSEPALAFLMTLLTYA